MSSWSPWMWDSTQQVFYRARKEPHNKWHYEFAFTDPEPQPLPNSTTITRDPGPKYAYLPVRTCIEPEPKLYSVHEPSYIVQPNWISGEGDGVVALCKDLSVFRLESETANKSQTEGWKEKGKGKSGKEPAGQMKRVDRIETVETGLIVEKGTAAARKDRRERKKERVMRVDGWRKQLDSDVTEDEEEQGIGPRLHFKTSIIKGRVDREDILVALIISGRNSNTTTGDVDKPVICAKMEALTNGLQLLQINSTPTDPLTPPSMKPLDNSPVFHPFPRLAPELRLQIWEAARPEPRVIRIFPKKYEGEKYFAAHSTAKVPTLLQTCRESRKVALEWYTLSFSTFVGFPNTIYFDNSSDIAYLSCEKCKGEVCVDTISCGMSFLDIFTDTQNIIKRVVYEYNAPNTIRSMIYLWLHHTGTEEVLLVEGKHGLGSRSEASLSNIRPGNQVYRWQQGRSLMDAFHYWTGLLIQLGSYPQSNVSMSIKAVEFAGSEEIVKEGRKPAA
ncbi:hypothetical protein EG329_012415 [Mollisiaceae sp. DMI_Dod_QoI]|nr:hypothetical protein EG329_012415 [Helotiales sp. DMI_Dod_QoI]